MDKLEEKVTIVHIAKMANVSVSTVSRVLNKQGPVDPKTRQRILSIIEKTNYVPNKLAQGFVSRHSKTVALIIPDVANPFFADIIHGVENTLVNKGYSMYLCNSNFDHDRERSYLEDMAQRRVEGVILISAFLQNEDLVRQLNQNTLRIVCIQTQIEGLDCVNTTDYLSMCQAIQHLIDLGHRRIGFICIDRRGCKMRYRAYQDVLAKNGIEPNPEYLQENVQGVYAENPGYYMTRTLLEQMEPPTAIQALNDYLAYGAYQAIAENGLRIPQDVSVIGCDDLPLSRLLSPPLTTIRQPAYQMGEAGSEMLIKCIEEGPRKPDQARTERILDTEFVLRASTGAPKCLGG